MRKYLLPLVFVLCQLQSFAQTPCEAGQAAGYSCQNIDFWTHVPAGIFGGGTTNEVWGWTDSLDGKEYVLLGVSNGVSFFDIADPANPIYLGYLPTHTVNSLWRTVRTYQNYMFVGSEAGSHGLQVFDLTRLRNPETIPATFAEDAHYAGFGKCHTLVIDEDAGMLYACGTNTFAGGLHIVNIANPLMPALAGGYDLDGYTHEAQVMTYNGPDADYQGHTIVFCYNGNNPANLTIVDATDVSDVTTVSITGYEGSAYCHQGWLTEDGRFLLMDDELDEYYSIYQNTRTLIWNVEDLDNPEYLADFIGPTEAIDHNQYIIGNLSFQSNYTAGVRVVDVQDIDNLNLAEVAYFDHYPSSDDNVFQGTWMNYPYFESGIIPVTDIYNGMFLLELNMLHILEDEQSTYEGMSATYALDLAEGFLGPITISCDGLPEGFTYSVSDQNVMAPTTMQLTITAPQNGAGDYTFDVVATGQHYTFRREADLHVINVDECLIDLNNDGVVGSDDFMIAWSQFGCAADCSADVNFDFEVNGQDLLLIIGAWGLYCE
jgi:choice-of-anchor B domain-containing protein